MKLFEEEVFFYGTFGGETLSLAATKATLEELKEKNVPQYLNEKGTILRDGYNDIARSLGMDYTRAEGYGYRSAIEFDPVGGTSLELKTLVQQEMIKRGVLWGGYNTMSFSHTDDDINYILSAYEDTLPILKKAVDENNVRGHLRGATIEPSIRRIHSFNTKPKKKQ
jgi:glutamate-1-semialdehyde aminotransferase